MIKHAACVLFYRSTQCLFYYWGCGTNKTGKNMLGKILVEIRAEIRALR